MNAERHELAFEIASRLSSIARKWFDAADDDTVADWALIAEQEGIEHAVDEIEAIAASKAEEDCGDPISLEIKLLPSGDLEAYATLVRFNERHLLWINERHKIVTFSGAGRVDSLKFAANLIVEHSGDRLKISCPGFFSEWRPGDRPIPFNSLSVDALKELLVNRGHTVTEAETEIESIQVQ